MYVTTSLTFSPMAQRALSTGDSAPSFPSRSRATPFRETPPGSLQQEASMLSGQRQIPGVASVSRSASAATPTGMQQRNWATGIPEREEEDISQSAATSNLYGNLRGGPLNKDTSASVCNPETVTIPTTTVTIASLSNAAAAASHAARESLVQWRRPPRPVVFREWYISRYCNEQQVRWIERMQHIFRPVEPLLIRYFQLWSLTGEAEFYTLFIPTVVWLGVPSDGVQIASLLCMSQYITGTMKDSVCCPRPPCPPLELRGKRETHDTEYGFPSTHSSHSGVFSFFLYCELLRFMPTHPIVCWLIAFFYFVNVSFSRIYLGMHWIGDLIGGWSVAFLSILFHVSFLNAWEMAVISVSHPPWWAFVLLYALFHILTMAHATPHDPCPCYIDSMRFVSVMVGACLGFWCFYSVYGTLAARQEPKHVGDVFFTWSFLTQWLTCMVVVFVSKELSSLVAGVVLKGVFKFLAGVYATKLPRPLRAPYLAMARAVGLTTSGNERGTRRYIPFTPNNSFSFMNNANLNESTLGECGVNANAGAGGHGGRDSTVSVGSVGAAGGTAATGGGGVGGGGGGAGSAMRGGAGGSTSVAMGDTVPIEEPDGYIGSQQVWSLRTHRHWWLWEVHKRSVSYALTGFVMSFVCPMILREVFGVQWEKDIQDGPAIPSAL